MSQFGMQMQGSRSRRAEWSTIYTVMLLIACLTLVAACAFMWSAAGSLSPTGQPWELQDAKNIKLPAAP